MVYPILNPIFQPAMRDLDEVTFGLPTVFTTTQPHLYRTGLIVRILWPANFGTWQLNNIIGPIVVTGASAFTMNIDSTNFDPPVLPGIPSDIHSYPQVIPVGEVNSQLSQSAHNIYGS